MKTHTHAELRMSRVSETLTRSKQASRTRCSADKLLMCNMYNCCRNPEGVYEYSWVSRLPHVTIERLLLTSSLIPIALNTVTPGLWNKLQHEKKFRIRFFHPKSYLVERWLNCWDPWCPYPDADQIKWLPWTSWFKSIAIYIKLVEVRNFRWCQL